MRKMKYPLTNTERLSRLKELKYIMDNHSTLFKTVEFNITTWGDKRDGVQAPASCILGKRCASAACVLGSAALHTPFKKLGLYSHVTPHGDVTISLRGVYNPETSEKYMDDTLVGATFFGITNAEALRLFMPERYRAFMKTSAQDSVTPAMVSKRIQTLINRYSAAKAKKRAA